MKDFKIKEIELDNGEVIKRTEWFSEHWYSVNSVENPLKSVTMVLGVVDKGYAYSEWLKATGINSDYISRIAKEKGSFLHNTIERAIYGEEISVDHGFGEIMEKREWIKLENWFNWWEWMLAENELETHRVEQIVYNQRLGVAGTADWIGKVNGEVWLFDWKTGNAIHDESDLQVSIYAYMYNKMIERKEIDAEPIQRVAVVHVGAKNKKNMKGTYHAKGIKVHEVVDWNTYGVRNFRNVLETFNWKNPDIKAPNEEHLYNFKLSGGTLESEVMESAKLNTPEVHKSGGDDNRQQGELFQKEGGEKNES
jgi:hypothetical protein